MSEGTPTSEPSKPPQWKPIAALDRRVAGVLVEKAKTTPEQYPLSLNALVNGCNQKNNRDPQMQSRAGGCRGGARAIAGGGGRARSAGERPSGEVSAHDV